VPVGTIKTAITAITPCRHGVIDPHTLNLKADVVAISASFSVLTQRVMVNPYRLCGTTYKSHFQGLFFSFLTPEDGTDNRLSRNVGIFQYTLRKNLENRRYLLCG
jgi:hypothetical protein